ncbi:amidinotransferase [Micromonospora tulbaghiae]|uniref:amidinotransferase n=1 Tax=Micromonospora tulbaghiae TaxID=479978 RepID=UPI00366025C4
MDDVRAAVPGDGDGPVVWSCDEWSPLEEVIVGTARGAVRSPFEPAFAPFAPPNSAMRRWNGGRVAAEEIDRAERQLDAFVRLLETEGVAVRRPEPIDHGTAVRTPDFDCAMGHAQACPRDVLLVVGDEIIEAPMSHRCRYFEYRAYRKLVRDYCSAGARWTAAPKPLMADDLYVAGYETQSAAFDFATHPNLTEVEPVFDAACFIRCGRDIFWQPDIVSNQSGVDWLQRHLGPAYRIHRVEFEDRYPHHIDTTLVPLRPGLVLVNPERPAKHDGLKLFEQNDWRVVDAVPSVRPRKHATAWEVSNWISLNILSLDERTVVVDEVEEPFIDLLRSLGCDVLTTPFDAVFQFGGSFHCCTTDIRRRGPLASYFPSLD